MKTRRSQSMAKIPMDVVRTLCTLGIIGGFSLGGISSVPSASAQDPAYPCKISVYTYLKSGAEKKRVFPAKSATTETECAKQAKLHETNFYTPGIARKDVRYFWRTSEFGHEEGVTE